jgi:predicted permease
MLHRAISRPSYLAATTLSIALASCAVVQAIVRAGLEPRLPVRDQAALYELGQRPLSAAPDTPLRGTIVGAISEWRHRAKSIDRLGLFSSWSPVVDTPDGPEHLTGLLVEPELFETLGTAPSMGHLFDADGTCAGASPGVVLSDGYWATHFGRRSDVVGLPIVLDGQSHVICGVMPPGFHFPLVPRDEMDAVLWRSTTIAEISRTPLGRRAWQSVVARLAPGPTAQEAQRELQQIGDAAGQLPARSTVALIPLGDYATRQIRLPLYATQGLAVLLLLLAMANGAAIALSESEARRSDVLIRSALGGSPRRLVFAVWRRSAAVGLAPVLAACALAWAVVRLLSGFSPWALPPYMQVVFGARMFAFTLLAGLAVTSVMAFIPAADAWRHIRRGGQLGRTMRVGRPSVRPFVFLVLAGTQFALAICLVIGAGLLGRSIQQLLTVDRGFEASRVLSAQLAVPFTADRRPIILSLAERLLATGREQPWAERVAVSTTAPLLGSDFEEVELRAGAWRERVKAVGISAVSTDYFRTLGTRVLRPLSGATLEPDAAIIDEGLARRFPAGVDPLDAQVLLPVEGSRENRRPYSVVGIVGGTRPFIRDVSAAPHVYVSFNAAPSTLVNVLVRYSGQRANAEAMRKWLRAQAPGIPLTPVLTIQDRLRRAVARERFIADVAAFLALAAFFMACIGVYGAIRFLINNERRHFAIRLAVGASVWNLLGIVLRRAATVVGSGLSIGLVLGMALASLVSRLLFEVRVWDWKVIATSTALALLSSTVAVALPFRNLTKSDLTRELRRE